MIFDTIQNFYYLLFVMTDDFRYVIYNVICPFFVIYNFAFLYQINDTGFMLIDI